MFYVSKRSSRLASHKSKERESIGMDFQKNLPTLNITTNDVYYKRQLTVIMFNIHVLSSADSVAGKGSDEVASFLFDFVMCKLEPAVTELDIFCDSCAGQNTNWKSSVRHITWCIMSKDSSNDWFEEFISSRAKTSHFIVIEVDKSLVRTWTEHFEQLCSKKCHFESRPIREIIVERKRPRLMQHRSTFNGHWHGDVVNKSGSVPREEDLLPKGEFLLPDIKLRPLPVIYEKYCDLQALKRFFGEDPNDFYSNIPKMEPGETKKSQKKKTEKRLQNMETRNDDLKK
ncbi:hypothetical protein J6590_102701 [Homalodisca vitripennis]|nr:hypothetical protein J6590_102701 [Homalodisca vitripennis]